MTFASGSNERGPVPSHASAQLVDKSYAVNGTCATQSGKVTQNRRDLSRLTANRYRGNFHNPEFDITGTISVVVHGRNLTATLTSSSGTGRAPQSAATDSHRPRDLKLGQRRSACALEHPLRRDELVADSRSHTRALPSADFGFLRTCISCAGM